MNFKVAILFALVAVAVARPNDAEAEVLSSNFDEVPGESYNFDFETSNGIKVDQKAQIIPGATEEEGSQAASGSYKFTADDGNTYTVTWTAGEEGFAPVGDHLPTPPPLPEHVKELLATLGLRK